MKAAGLLLLACCAAGQVLWQPPKETGLAHWTCGPGGCAREPAPPFQFLKEESGGTNPKVDVRDAKGREWSVKFGAEVIPDCFASRFVTALGYLAEPAYYVGSGKISGTKNLRRTRRMVKPDGTFARARFEARGLRDFEFLQGRTWGWNDNPFRGSHELGGLKIVMMLLSNWDAKDAREGDDSNNGVFRVEEGGRAITMFGVFDWGASLGHWGGLLRRDQSDCSGFTLDTPKFVRAGPNRLEWGFSGKHAEDLKDVTLNDVRWLLPHLSGITHEDLLAGLKASGATDRQAGCWSGSIESRIRELHAAAK